MIKKRIIFSNNMTLSMSNATIFKILSFIFLLYGNVCLGQKKIIYINDELEQITKEQFEQPIKLIEYNSIIETDSIIFAIRVNRTRSGRLSEQQYDLIKKYLNDYLSSPILSSDIIVINYYPGKDPCNSSGDKESIRQNYYSYIKRIKKKKNVKQFFIYKTSEGTELYGEDIKWYKDPEKLIEKNFFKLHYPCGSYVVIQNDGSYTSYKGEYNIKKILDILE